MANETVPPILKVESLSKHYHTPGRSAEDAHALQVLNAIDLEIAPAEMVSIVGHSGVGKSTLLQILGTLDHPSSGRVTIDGVDVFALPPKALAAFRNEKLGFIFQFHHLLAEFSALENVALPLLIGGEKARVAHEKAAHYLELVGLKARLKHKPGELSGGEAQRVAIARALVRHPKIVFADEPTGNLDTNTSNDIHGLLVELNEQLKTAFVVVTHNLKLAWLMQRHLFLTGGGIRELSPEEAAEGFLPSSSAPSS